MSKVFISHNSKDDAFVRELRRLLADHGVEAWIDSRELLPGGLLQRDIQKAIEQALAYAVLVSPESLQSKWVGKELRCALDVQKKRGRDRFPIIPLSLDGTKLGVLEQFFEDEPIHIPVTTAAGGIETAMNALLIALGKRLPADIEPVQQPPAEPLEDLVLELTDLKFVEQEGVRRASGRARLVYEPATPGQPEVASVQSWRFVAPLGPIEAEELRWYFEKFAIWPSEYFRDRARKVQENLVKWGQLLHGAALSPAYTSNVMQAWARIEGDTGRRFSVHVDIATEAGSPTADAEAARATATLLLSLPWELLHDGDGFLFQGAKPTRVRRRLPNTRVLDVPVVATPIRILLVTARPEDDACAYIDHRASALPLVETIETLGGLVRLHVLSPPTLPALREELDRARRIDESYHVVHFDGHGVYDHHVGLGGLCFEEPQDVGKLERRRHATVFTDEIGSLLHNHRIPLVFLEACQTAQAENASESVASELLRVGVASVVAMSHSVLVETARRFVEAFYAALTRGARVGDAMLAGQRTLKDDTFRGRVFGAGELRLEDWFVPVLFQEKGDPQLFLTTPPRQAQHDLSTGLAARLGELPSEPKSGFVGRSRELLWLQRLLRHERYAVVRGQGGEGKTALAAEFARWMVRSHQIRRAVFVSVETHSDAAAVLDAIGRQLLPGYSVATFKDIEEAFLPIERALVEQSTVLVADNMESILAPPYVKTPEALSEDSRSKLEAILKLCARMNEKGDTRLVFTSREALPAPFDAELHRRELHELGREDAVKLVERALNRDAADAGDAGDAAREAIEELVDTVHGHARTLALLALSLRTRGVDATRTSLVELMGDMDRRFPGNREKSVFASVELSLRRMSPTNRQKAQALGVFHGAVDLDVLRTLMKWEEGEVDALARDLIETGLASPDPYNHLTLDPALCPYLYAQMDATERSALELRWRLEMRSYVRFLDHQLGQRIAIAATLTVLELPNLFALLEQVQREGDAEATIDLTVVLFDLLRNLGHSRLLERLAHVRDAAANELAETWSHARFQTHYTRVEQRFATGRLREAFDGAQLLLQRAEAVGATGYAGADYDLAHASALMGRLYKAAGRPTDAIPLLSEAQQRFEAIERDRPSHGARMVSVCITERADCLRDLGRLDDAILAYEEAIRRDEQAGAVRDVAVGKGQLGTVRYLQRRYKDAEAAHAEARELFTRLNEPHSVAVSWHQTGMVYQSAGRPEAAEDAYRKSLSIEVRLGNIAGQADTLNQLGLLYDNAFNRTEEAATLIRQGADKYAEIRDAANEAKARTNLAIRLRRLRRIDEAREEVRRANECRGLSGHATEPWQTWGVLAGIEADAGNQVAAADANRKAIECYLAYRRDGGENQSVPGRLALAVSEQIRGDGAAAAAAVLHQLAGEPKAADLRPFIRALQAVVGGSHDRTLADAPELHYSMAAEILFLIETLEGAGS